MKRTLRKLTVACPLLVFFLVPALMHAQTPLQAWVQRYDGPGNGADYAYAVAVDHINNVIVTGTSWSGTSSDYATIKYSSSGVPLWTNRYNGTGNGDDQANAVVVDGNNDVLVTGYSLLIGFNGDYATIKYSSAGAPLWTNRYNGPGNGDDQANAVAVDTSNNVIVTGYSDGGASSHDYATIKYSNAGVPLWTNRYNGPGSGYDGATALAVDGSNNVIVTGYADGGGSSSDYTTIKYSSAGAPLWTNRYNGPGNGVDQANAMVVDGSNNVIVTGYSDGGASTYDYATIKYSSTGIPLWTNRYNGPANGDDEAVAVAVDNSGNVIVTGYSVGNGSSYDYATILYSSAGVPLWTNRYNGPGNGNDYTKSLAVDGSGNVVVTGYSFGGPSTNDYATIKYSSAGVPLWTNRYDGAGKGDDQATAVAVDGVGNVIVTGYSTGSVGDYDFGTVKYVSALPPPVMTCFQMTNGMFQMRVDDVLQACTVVIEASTDLAGWAPVFTNPTPTNPLFYDDPDAGTVPSRFYRAFQFP